MSIQNQDRDTPMYNIVIAKSTTKKDIIFEELNLHFTCHFRTVEQSLTAADAHNTGH